MITDEYIHDSLDAVLLRSLDDYSPETRRYVLSQLVPTVRRLIDTAEDDVREDERYNAMGDDR
jgi:hypothetical protein